MQFRFWPFDLKLANTWAIASRLGPGGAGGTDFFRIVLVELRDSDGVVAWGEAAPSTRYQENPDSVLAFLSKVRAEDWNFSQPERVMAELERIAPGNSAAKGALNMALLDGAAQKARQPLWRFLGLDFREGKHLTSFSVGIDSPEVVRDKVKAAQAFPILKLKLGTPEDDRILAALRSVAPDKRVRVDGNEAWAGKEEALRKIEWLATDRNIEFVEQPMPARTDPRDLAWLKARSPLPLMADESYRNAGDLAACQGLFDAVNVKLVKAGGVTGAIEALRKARAAGLKTMLGCMIESSVLISAAAHLASLTDYLDLDGNLLVSNDPFDGVHAPGGLFSFATAPGRFGLQVRPR